MSSLHAESSKALSITELGATSPRAGGRHCRSIDLGIASIHSMQVPAALSAYHVKNMQRMYREIRLPSLQAA